MPALLVAVVDDEEPIRRALGRLLRAAGLVAECFPTGQAFLDSIVTSRPDCVILDLHMPGLGGLQVLEQLKLSHAPALPTIIITGHDEPDNEVRSLAGGAAAYMRKPLDDELLLQTIERAVRNQGSGSQTPTSGTP